MNLADPVFRNWLKQLDSIAKERGHEGSMVEQTGEDCWVDFYLDGMTPKQAYNEDMRND